MPPQLFDSGLSGALSGEYGMPEMNMDYSGGMPSMGGDPFASMYPQSAAYGDVFPDVNAGQYMQNYAPKQEKPNIFQSIIQGAFAGMAAGAAGPGGIFGGLGSGFVGAQKYQQAQEDLQLQRERQAKEDQMKQEQHEANMGLLNVQTMAAYKNMDLMDKQDARAMEKANQETIKFLTDQIDDSLPEGMRVGHLGSANLDDPDALKQLQADAQKLTGGQLKFLQVPNLKTNTMELFSIDQSAVTTQPTSIHMPNGNVLDLPANLPVIDGLKLQIEAEKALSENAHNKYMEEYYRSIAGVRQQNADTYEARTDKSGGPKVPTVNAFSDFLNQMDENIKSAQIKANTLLSAGVTKGFSADEKNMDPNMMANPKYPAFKAELTQAQAEVTALQEEKSQWRTIAAKAVMFTPGGFPVIRNPQGDPEVVMDIRRDEKTGKWQVITSPYTQGQ